MFIALHQQLLKTTNVNNIAVRSITSLNFYHRIF